MLDVLTPSSSNALIDIQEWGHEKAEFPVYGTNRVSLPPALPTELYFIPKVCQSKSFHTLSFVEVSISENLMKWKYWWWKTRCSSTYLEILVVHTVVAIEPIAVAADSTGQCSFLSTLFNAGGFSPFHGTKHGSLANGWSIWFLANSSDLGLSYPKKNIFYFHN